MEKGIQYLGQLKKQNNSKVHISQSGIQKMTRIVFNQFGKAAELINDVFEKENVLDIHNCDLVADPRGTLQKIFSFLEMDTTEHYLQRKSSNLCLTAET